MIDLTKKYKTRDGQEVTNLMRLPEPLANAAAYPIFGLVDGELNTWMNDGHIYNDINDDFDLIEARDYAVVFAKLINNKSEITDYGSDVENIKEYYRDKPNYKVVVIQAPIIP